MGWAGLFCPKPEIAIPVKTVNKKIFPREVRKVFLIPKLWEFLKLWVQWIWIYTK
jgi:hypothetical protein